MKNSEGSDKAQSTQFLMDGFERSASTNAAAQIPPPDSSPTEPTARQWAELYAVAGELNRIGPWNFLWDSDLVTIMLPGREEPVYCSVMGRNGECYAIGVYPGYEAIMGYHRLAKSSEDSPPFIAGFEQNCLMCNYGDRKEISPEDRKILKTLGLKFRGRNEWIYFRAMEPGYYPWYIDSKQADLLIITLQNLAMACKYLLTEEIKVNFNSGETLLRFYSPEKELWLNTAVQIPPVSIATTCLLIEDDLLVARLKNQSQNNQHLEFDLVYLPLPVQAHKEDRPYLPRFLMLADRKSGLLLDQNMAEPDVNIENAIIDMIAKYIEKHGRPSAIYVRDEQKRGYIDDLCRKIEIKLFQGKGMPVTNTFFEELLNFMG